MIDESVPTIKAGWESVTATWMSLMRIIEQRISRTETKLQSIAIILISVSILLIPIHWIISAVIIVVLLLVISLRENKLIGFPSILFVTMILILGATNLAYVMCANYVARENTIEDWEIYTPNTQSMIQPSEDVDGIYAWISRFSLPRIQRPSNTNFSDGGVFTWTEERDILRLAWNNTDRYISGWVRIRGFDVRMINTPETEVEVSIEDTGYFHELAFNFTPTLSLREISLQISPIISSDDFRIEYDLFEADINHIWVGQEQKPLAYLLSIDWLHLNIEWMNLDDQDYQIEVVSEDLELSGIEHPSWEDWNHSVTSYSITGKTFSSTTNHSSGFISISYRGVNGPRPLIRLSIDSTSSVVIYAEETSFLEGVYEVKVVRNDELFPSSFITTLSATPLMSIVLVITSSIVGVLIWKYSKLDLIMTSSTVSILMSVVVFLVSNSVNQLISNGFPIFASLTSYYYGVLSLRLSFITTGIAIVLGTVITRYSNTKQNEMKEGYIQEDPQDYTSAPRDRNISLA
jgi:hypothetical protein